MTVDEIKWLLREAKDTGDREAFIEGLKLLREHHPDLFDELMDVLDEPGGMLQ